MSQANKIEVTLLLDEVSNGIIIGGKDDGKPLFDQRSYKIKDD